MPPHTIIGVGPPGADLLVAAKMFLPSRPLLCPMPIVLKLINNSLTRNLNENNGEYELGMVILEKDLVHYPGRPGPVLAVLEIRDSTWVEESMALGWQRHSHCTLAEELESLT